MAKRAVAALKLGATGFPNEPFDVDGIGDVSERVLRERSAIHTGTNERSDAQAYRLDNIIV